MKTRWTVAYGVVAGLLGAGILWLVTSPPRGEAVRLLPPPTPEPLAVHVVGAVGSPGVYTLPEGSRVSDAVSAAGGLLAEAQDQAVNLAVLLQDGEQVRIPFSAQTGASNGSFQDSVAAQDPSAGGSVTGALIDINTASLAELESLPGIGPVTAQKILEHRQSHGPFSTIEEIQQVSGIGPATFERIELLITAGRPP